jgi:hypothetical protein
VGCNPPFSIIVVVVAPRSPLSPIATRTPLVNVFVVAAIIDVTLSLLCPMAFHHFGDFSIAGVSTADAVVVIYLCPLPRLSHPPLSNATASVSSSRVAAYRHRIDD